PLNAIIGMIAIGLGTDDVERKNYCLERANSASKHLLGVINESLDASKAGASAFEPVRGEIEVARMLIDVTGSAEARAEGKRQRFTVVVDRSVPEYIVGDETMISHAVSHLLSNAVRFTPEGGRVSLGVGMGRGDGGGPALTVEVKDTGIGISKDQQAEILRGGDPEGYGGAPASGLATVRRMVERMGGALTIESDLGKGAAFRFAVDVGVIERPMRKAMLADLDPGEVKVLVAGEEKETRDIASRVMASLGIQCAKSARGTEALEEARFLDARHNLAFVGRDLGDMTCVEFAVRLREMGRDVSVIMMAPMSEWGALPVGAEEAGIRRSVPVPFLPSVLVEALRTAVAESAGDGRGEDAPKAKKRQDFTGLTILIAEDLEVNREIASSILIETGVGMDFAVDGMMAVEMFSKDPGRYDAILMDISMPVMDGYAATRAIRALGTEKARRIPILAMTAKVSKEEIEGCLASGMNDHTGKPIDSGALIGMLGKHLLRPGEGPGLRNVYELEWGMAWDERLYTGNALIDMQRHGFFRKVSEIIGRCEEGESTEGIADTLEFLRNYTVRHFADEEALLLSCGYPDYAAHKRMHEDFGENVVGGLLKAYGEIGPTRELAARANLTVINWLASHIKDEDAKAGIYVRKAAHPK
ncbi:MAG: response regulator, partial [Oscillospiraceae bacterium]|nr:response regulator [Oscillospiraceae bacterium]